MPWKKYYLKLTLVYDLLNIRFYSHRLLISATNGGADKLVFMQRLLWLVKRLVSTDGRVNNAFTAATGFNTRMFPKLNTAAALWLGAHSLYTDVGGLNVFRRESDRWVNGGWQMRENGQNGWFLISCLHSIPTSIAANNPPPSPPWQINSLSLLCTITVFVRP